MAAFAKPLARLSLLALLLGPACAGGQTGEEGNAGGPCLMFETSEADAAALLEQYAGTYQAPAVRSASDERCPSAGYTTLEVTITGAVSEEELEEKPCGARFIPVSVEVSTDDGEPSTTFQGWLREEGIITGEGYTLILSSSTKQVLSLSGFGLLRIVEGCCLEPPPEEVASGVELGTTELLTFDYCGDEDCTSVRTTELSLSLTTSSAAEACGMLEATFELRTGAGELAASGDGSMEFSSTSCDGADPPCLAIGYMGAGSVTDQALFLGYADFAAELGSLDLTFEGTTRGGQLENNFMIMEVSPLALWTGTIPP